MPDQVVVGAAIVHEGRLLAARRTRPAPAAGRWELPGGKVEPGESPEVAVVREIAEELGCAIEVEDWLAGQTRIGPGLVLRVARVRLVGGGPHPHEHDAVRWLTGGELDEMDWLDADRPFLVELRRLLTRPTHARAILLEEDDARAAALRLVADGYDAIVVRERFAGEDDDTDEPTGGPVAPHDLPVTPRRGERPDQP